MSVNSIRCAVCLNDRNPAEQAQMAMLNPCRHRMDASCIKQWIFSPNQWFRPDRTATCPLCRGDVADLTIRGETKTPSQIVDEANHPLLIAIESGDLGAVQDAIADRELIITAHTRGLSVIHAARSNRFDLLEILLASGPITDPDRGRAVKWAAQSGHLNCVRALLHSGSISAEDRETAKMRAQTLGHHEIVSALQPKSRLPLYAAIGMCLLAVAILSLKNWR